MMMVMLMATTISIQSCRSGLSGRFKLYYTLDFPPENWAHKTGFITADMPRLQCFLVAVARVVLSRCKCKESEGSG